MATKVTRDKNGTRAIEKTRGLKRDHGRYLVSLSTFDLRSLVLLRSSEIFILFYSPKLRREAMAQKLDLTRYSPTFPEFVANGETLPSNGDRKLTVSPDEYSIASSLYSTRPDRTTDSKAIADRVSSGNNKSMIDGISTQFSKNELENSPLAKTAFGTFTIDSRPFLDPNSSSMLIDEEVPWDEERWKRTIDEEEPWEAEEEDSQPLDFSIKKKPKIYFHAGQVSVMVEKFMRTDEP